MVLKVGTEIDAAAISSSAILSSSNFIEDYLCSVMDGRLNSFIVIASTRVDEE